jgi:hypothetical protein
LDEPQQVDDLQAEIKMLREFILQLYDAARGCQDITELSSALNTLGLAVTRVAGLIKVQKSLEGDHPGFLEDLNKALEIALQDFKLIGE